MKVIHRSPSRKYTVKSIPAGTPFKLGIGATSVHLKVDGKSSKMGCNAVCLQNGCLEYLGDHEPAFPIDAEVVVKDGKP